MAGDDEIRVELGQRLESESPLVEPRMRDGEPRLVERLVAVEEQVEVDRPRPEARTLADPPEGAFDGQEGVQELPRGQRRVDRGGSVQEARLVEKVHRVGVAEGGDRDDHDSLGCVQRRDRCVERALALAEVRAEADVRARHHATLTLAGYPAVLARAAVAVSLLALVLSPSALAARAASPRPATPGLLSIGAFERTLVQLERGSLSADGGTLISPSQRIWVLPTRDAQRVLPTLLARGLVRSVEPDRPVELLHATAEPLIGFEYWRALVGADAAVPPGPGKPITVLDTGVDVTHEEFAGRPNTVMLGPQDLTDSDDDFHGTAVSSVVAAPENGLGVLGVYPQAVLRSVDVGDLTVASVISAFVEAMRAGPSVINMSFGVPYTRLLEDTLLAAFASGSILVASSGNERQEGTAAGPPGNLAHVLTVAATDQRNDPAEFSTPSLGVDLAAPGVDIPVAIPRLFRDSGYAAVDGTSFSAPIVTGATAWVWTARPTLDNTQIFELMRATATDVSASGFDRDTGFGVLNIPNALTAAAPPKDPSEPNDDIRQVRAGGLFRTAVAPITAPNRPRTTFRASLDVTEDPEDVYRVFVPAGRSVRITATPDTDVDVDVWKASASSVFLRGTARARNLLATSGKDGKAPERVSVRNRTRAGFYVYLDVYLPRNGSLDARYTLTVSTVRP